MPPHWTGPWRARGTHLLGVLLPEVPDVHVVLIHGREVEEREGEGEKRQVRLLQQVRLFRETKKAFVRAELCEPTENSGS